MSRYFALALLALCPALFPLAQAPPPQDPPGAEEATPHEEGPRREMARLRLLSQMRQRLGLSEAQTVRVLSLFEAMEVQRERQRKEMRGEEERLRALVDAPASTETALREAIATFEKLRESHQRENDTREMDLLAVLTPRQQAQWLLLRRELMGGMADRMDGRPMGPRGAGPRPGGPRQRPLGP